jgi:four helix bundle protein
MEESKVYNKAYSFAIAIVQLFQTLQDSKKEYILSKQLLRCGTSIGANISEANGAISSSEFSAKMSIAYKESLETKYWLSLLKDTNYIDSNTFEKMYTSADEIGKMLFAIIKTTRKF